MSAILARNSFLFINSTRTLRCLSTFGTSFKRMQNFYQPDEHRPRPLLESTFKQIQVIQIKRPMSKGNHSTLWNAEKLISLAFVGLFPMVICCPHPVTDYTIAALLVFHHYVGIESVIVDYGRPSVVGGFLAAFFKYLNVAMAFVVLFGLIQFSKHDMLFGQALHLMWSLDNKSGKRGGGDDDEDSLEITNVDCPKIEE